MLRIYGDALELVRAVRPVVAVLERRDPDLARQFRRALASGPLNVSEGSEMSGGNRTQRYRSALGSMREALACLEVAEAAGYVGPVEPALAARFNKVIGTLVNVVR
jgi:four helix bundle protein